MIRTLAIALLAACSWQDVKELGGGAGWDLPGFGVVHECDVGGEHYELCWENGDSAELAASISTIYPVEVSCWPTERHLGPCRWSSACDGAGGSNAHNGPWCPED